MGTGTLARRSWATMVTVLGLPRVCGIVDGDAVAAVTASA
jgi:hypothetical protein